MTLRLPQLRVRTEFSFRQAFGPLPRVAKALADLKTPVAGIVDNGTWGHVRWAAALEKAKVRPAFGTEVIVRTPGSDKRPSAWVLAADMPGFYEFSTAIRREDADVPALLRQYAGSLVRFAGAGLDDPDCFDYIDINPESPLASARSLELAKATGKPLVITSANYYPAPGDKGAFLVMGGRERTTPQHILSLDELRSSLASCFSQKAFDRVVRNTFEAAERCASALPTAPLIKVKGDFRKLVEAGRKRRLQLGHLKSWPAEYAARLKREIELIEEKKYESYFLVVADLVQWAKTKMLVGPGRGSSAGSLLCYLVGITEVDPIPHGLLFERFVDVNRNDLPDIDIDFNDNKRDMVFDYLRDKYSSACIARIGNISTLKARSVIAAGCKRFAIPDHEKFALYDVLVEYSSGDERYGKGVEDTFSRTDVGKRFAERHPAAMVMTELENHADHTSVHAAGVLVCNEPISRYCTVGADGVAQIDKPDAEKLNLLKVDALGLRTLGIMEDAAVATPEELYALKLDDPKVFDIFNKHRFSAIFQFEGAAQRSVAIQVHADDFRVIDHLTALARPGPLSAGAAQRYIDRRKGREEIEYMHDSLAPILNDTYGVVLYQEQVMRIVRDLGQFSWAETTTIRKAMSGRKGAQYFDNLRKQFLTGAATQGIPETQANAIWDDIYSFGAWGMNRCILGTTKVKLAHPNQFDGRNPTIAALYKRYKEKPSSWIRQRKSMPILMSMDAKGIGKPATAIDIIKQGTKECIRLVFRDGRKVECTIDHKFLINGHWQSCSNAREGDEFTGLRRDRSSTNTALIPGSQGWTKGRAWKNGKRPELNGKTRVAKEFKAKMQGSRCQEKGCKLQGEQVHHNDFCGGNERPKDLAWLCDGHHKKRHIEHGSRRAPYERGWKVDKPAILAKVIAIGPKETYDIEMPGPNHNFVLANGIVTHNSHTCAYAVISYWCAWFKAYHPLEFAAACLRSAKDDASTVAILREMSEEGYRYVPFDMKRSQANWAVIDGEIVGGWMNLEGIGPAKAAKALEDRAAGKLDPSKYLALSCKFSDLYPLQTEYRDYYETPEKFGIAQGSRILRSPEFPEAGDVLYIGRVTGKKISDSNEDVRVARRGGKRLDGPTTFIDFHCKDDLGERIICRIDRYNWDTVGRVANEKIATGDVLLIRGQRLRNFPMINIVRMRCLNKEGIGFEVPQRRKWRN